MPLLASSLAVPVLAQDTNFTPLPTSAASCTSSTSTQDQLLTQIAPDYPYQDIQYPEVVTDTIDDTLGTIEAGVETAAEVVGVAWDMTQVLTGCVMNGFFGLDCLLEGAVKLVSDLASSMVLWTIHQLVGDDIFQRISDIDPIDSEAELQEFFDSSATSQGLIGQMAFYNAAFMGTVPNSFDTYALVKGTLANNLLAPQPTYAMLHPHGSTLYGIIGDFWKTSLNIALGLSLLILIATGFAIMFSGFSFINGGFKVTIYSALPKIFSALMFAIFSLFIASFVWDIGWAISDLTINLFRNTGQQTMLVMGTDWPELIARVTTLFAVFALNAVLSGGLVVIFALLMGLILLIAGAYYLFKLLFAMLKALVGLYMSVIFAPLILILSALPGKSHLKFDWLRYVLSCSIVFPAIQLLMVLSFIFLLNLQIGVWGSGDGLIDLVASFAFINALPAILFIFTLGLFSFIAKTPKMIMENLGAEFVGGSFLSGMASNIIGGAKDNLSRVYSGATSAASGARSAVNVVREVRDSRLTDGGHYGVTAPIVRRLPTGVQSALGTIRPNLMLKAKDQVQAREKREKDKLKAGKGTLEQVRGQYKSRKDDADKLWERTVQANRAKAIASLEARDENVTTANIEREIAQHLYAQEVAEILRAREEALGDQAITVRDIDDAREKARKTLEEEAGLRADRKFKRGGSDVNLRERFFTTSPRTTGVAAAPASPQPTPARRTSSRPVRVAGPATGGPGGPARQTTSGLYVPPSVEAEEVAPTPPAQPTTPAPTAPASQPETTETTTQGGVALPKGSQAAREQEQKEKEAEARRTGRSAGGVELPTSATLRPRSKS